MKIALVILGTLIIVLCGIIFDQALTMTHTSVSMENYSKNHRSTLRLLNYGFRGKHKDEIVELGQLMEKEGSIFKVNDEQIQIDEIRFYFSMNIVTHLTEFSDSNLEKDFFDLPSEQREESFHKYSVDDQYRLLIFGNQFRHPPHIELAMQFAENGESVIPFLKEKLLEAEDDETIRDIAVTLSFMNSSNTYNVKADQDLIALLKKKIDTMNGYKEIVQEVLDEM